MIVELVKLFGRRRTWVALLLLNLLPSVVAALLAWTRIAPSPGQGPAFLSAVVANGSLFAIAALAVGLVTFSMLGVAAMALLLSTLTDSPLSASLGAMAFLIGSSLL